MKRKIDYSNQQAMYMAKYNNIYNIWMDRLKEIVITSIEWEGDTFYPEFSAIEKFLFTNGRCVAFMDFDYGFMILPATGSATLNPIGEPSEYMAYSMNGATFNGLKPDRDCVVILNNLYGFPGQNICSNYAERLTEIMITWMCNLNANKTPLTIAADEDDFLTVENYIQSFTLGVPMILLKNRLANFTPTSVRTDAPFIAPELTMELRSVWSEFLTYVGIPSMDINKNERLLKDEISQAMGGAIACRVPRMKPRRAAAKKIEQMFGIKMNPIFAIDNVDLPKYISRDGEEEPDKEGGYEE